MELTSLELEVPPEWQPGGPNGRGGPSESALAPELRLLIASPAPGPPEPLKLSRVPEAGGGEPFRTAGGDLRDLPVRPRAVAGGLLVEGSVPCVPGAEWILEGADTISPLVSIPPLRDACTEGQPWKTELLPKARLSGRVMAPRGHGLPNSGRIELRRCGDDRARRLFPVKIEEDGSWHAVIGAGCWSPKLRVGDFAPVDWPEAEVEAAGEARLPPTDLRLGAALLVQVVDPRDGRGLEGARVELVPASELDEAVRASYVSRDPIERFGTWSGPRGWLRLFGLEPRSIYLRVSRPGRATVFTPMVDLLAGREVTYEGVELPFPATLEVELLASGSYSEEGSSYEISLLPRLSCGATSVHLTKRVTEAGRAVWPDLAPGEWNLSVHEISSRALGRAVTAESLHLESGEHETRVIDLGEKVFTGVVTWQDEPVEGILQVEPVQGGASLQVGLDEDGGFELRVAKRGIYRAEVQNHLEGFRAVVEEVAFEDPSVPVQIELPTSGLRGVVKDSKGLGVKGATVEAWQISGPGKRNRDKVAWVRARSDEEGRYHLKSLEPGVWVVRAREGDRRTVPAEVEIEEEDLKVQNLDLAPGAPVRGRVLDSQDRPVSGARVVAMPQEDSFMGLDRPGRAETNPGGLFETRLDRPETGNASVLVLHPQHPITAFVRPTGTTHELRLPHAGARVDLHFGKRPTSESNVPEHLVLLKSEQGALVSLRDLVGRGAERLVIPGGVTYRISSLAPGSWTVERYASSEDLVTMGLGEGRLEEIRFHAVPGMTHHVPVPSPPEAEEGKP